MKGKKVQPITLVSSTFDLIDLGIKEEAEALIWTACNAEIPLQSKLDRQGTAHQSMLTSHVKAKRRGGRVR